MERVKLRPFMTIVICSNCRRTQNRIVWTFMESFAQRSIAVYLILFFGTEFIRLGYIIVLTIQRHVSPCLRQQTLEEMFPIPNKAGFNRNDVQEITASEHCPGLHQAQLSRRRILIPELASSQLSLRLETWGRSTNWRFKLERRNGRWNYSVFRIDDCGLRTKAASGKGS